MPVPRPRVQVFDPPQCCPTGVCGPDPDPVLASFAAALRVLEAGGVPVRRVNLASEPTAFADDPVARRFLTDAGADALPLVIVDGQELCRGGYPSMDALAGALGLTTDGGACAPGSGCC